MKILIVGAGPTGLTAAVELGRRGIVPTVIDQRGGASPLSRAVGITARSLELLVESGVSERLIGEGVAVEGVWVYRGSRLALHLPLHSERAFFPTILALPQDRTENIMADTFASLGGEVRYGVKLEGLHQEEGQVTARFADRTEAVFDIVIGADGVKSTVREAVGIAYPGIDLQRTWSISNVELESWRHPRSFTLARAGAGTVVFVVPMGGRRYRLVASCDNALQALPLPVGVTRIIRQGTFNISVRQAETYSINHIHLAGDAAHCHSPVGGRGMNIGIADAADLARRLVEGGIEGYSARRHQEGAATIAVTERGRKIITGTAWWRPVILRMFLAAVRHITPLQRRVSRFMIEF